MIMIGECKTAGTYRLTAVYGDLCYFTLPYGIERSNVLNGRDWEVAAMDINLKVHCNDDADWKMRKHKIRKIPGLIYVKYESEISIR